MRGRKIGYCDGGWIRDGMIRSFNKRIWAAAGCTVALLSPLAGHAAEPAVQLVSLDDRGVDSPPVGRSLFDFLVAREVDGEWVLDVPYPFEDLVTLIESRLGEGFREPVKQVLHPLGRSLHRYAADPHYFRFPRAVAAVDTDPLPDDGHSGLMLKDRLYLGYQPVTESVEVIAYNEAAARFEYQVVTDYRDGGVPRVTYADRGLCTACHHNQALIYAVQPWAESNNNPKIAALLLQEADTFYGINARIPFDIPESFDEATDRANYFSAYQLAWNEGCAVSGNRDAAIQCRRDGLVAALRYRLTGGYQLSDPGDGARAGFSASLTRGWLARWPGGIEIPTADLLDHDPLADAGYGSGTLNNEDGLKQLIAMASPDLIRFDEIYEPLYERTAAVKWKVAAPFSGLPPVEPSWINKVIAGLGGFLAAADIERLDRHLRAGDVGDLVVEVPCEMKSSKEELAVALTFSCAPADMVQFALAGLLRVDRDGAVHGMISRLRPDSAAPGGFAFENATVEREGNEWRVEFGLRDTASGLRARSGTGNAIRRIRLAWIGGQSGPTKETGTAIVTMADDFASLVTAIDELAAETREGRSDALDDTPFRRVAVLRPIFKALSIAPMAWCCLEAEHLPAPVLLND